MAYLVLGLVLARMEEQRHKEAEECIERALMILDEYRLRPWFANGTFTLGEFYTRSGHKEKALENLKKGLESVGATFADLVVANRFLTDLSQQDILNKVWNEYMGDNKPTTTTVQVVQLATDPRCLVEINAIAVID